MENARQQIVDSIKKSNNILVAVSTNPSVDGLSAALGLSIILNNMDKRATAIFSGDVPPAINFLEPDKTFEDNADSLRDFIIALNKEKADHLRYKVDGDVVKIFITPYKTTLSKDDLEFSMGDYNVDLVLALGVKDQDHLDKALESHGKILHDATVVTITAGEETSSLGSLDWHDAGASSLSEMIVSLADGLKSDGPILDQQIATSLLTGIVSATGRFSNDHTTSRAMTMAAQLMAAGANQQLIAAKLEEGNDIGPGSTPKPSSKPKDKASELTIERAGSKDKESKPLVEEKPISDSSEKSGEEKAQEELEKQLAGLTTVASGTLEDIEKELKETAEPLEIETSEEPANKVDLPVAPAEPTPTPEPVVELPSAAPEVPEVVPAPSLPSFAPPITTSAEPVVESTSPQIVNEHGSLSATPPESAPPINSIQDNPNDGEAPTVDPFGGAAKVNDVSPPDTSMNLGTPEGAAILSAEPTPAPAPVVPSPQAPPSIPTIPELPPLPPLPTDLSLPPLPPPPPPPPAFGMPPGGSPSGAVSGDVFGDGAGIGADVTPPPPTKPPEPGQFKIPGSS